MTRVRRNEGPSFYLSPSFASLHSQQERPRSAQACRAIFFIVTFCCWMEPTKRPLAHTSRTHTMATTKTDISTSPPRPTGAHYDAVVVGAGIMGSCAAYHLAKRGKRVLLLEQFELLHRRGSSHGDSRIIRRTYPEEVNTEMMMHAYPLWESAQVRKGGRTRTPRACVMTSVDVNTPVHPRSVLASITFVDGRNPLDERNETPGYVLLSLVCC